MPSIVPDSSRVRPCGSDPFLDTRPQTPPNLERCRPSTEPLVPPNILPPATPRVSASNFLPAKTSTPANSADRRLWERTGRRDRESGVCITSLASFSILTPLLISLMSSMQVQHLLGAFGGPPHPLSENLKPLELKRTASLPATRRRREESPALSTPVTSAAAALKEQKEQDDLKSALSELEKASKALEAANSQLNALERDNVRRMLRAANVLLTLGMVLGQTALAQERETQHADLQEARSKLVSWVPRRNKCN